MPLMMSKLYLALKAAGSEESLAREAAEEAANYENRFDSIEQRLVRIEERFISMEERFKRLGEYVEGRFRLLYWMVGFNLAMTVAVLWKLFK